MCENNELASNPENAVDDWLRFGKIQPNMDQKTEGFGMRKGENFNHPRKGDSVKVEPIKGLADIAKIKKLLADKPRELALFLLGINTNLRASDMVALTAGQMRPAAMGEFELEIIEKKKRNQATHKRRRITINKTVATAVTRLLASRDYRDEDMLFQGQRGPITAVTVNRMVKGWCAAIGLRGNFGSHTLRKTWGYHQRTTFGVDIPTLMVCFNHATQRQTLDYLCIQPEEIRSVYSNEL